MEFKDLIKLNKDTLDEDVIKQVDLYYEWSEKWAKAVLERDKAKEDLTVTIAEASQDIRTNPEQYGWEFDKAPTETFINSKIPLHPLVREKQAKLNNLQFDINVYSSAKDTLEQRGRALNILTELYKGEYYTTTKIRQTSSAITKEQQKELGTNMRLKRKI